MPDELPLPEWPRPSRETESSDDVAEFTPVPVSSESPSSFEPVSTEGRREPDEFQVQVEDARDSVPLPEWPKPSRDSELPSESSGFEPVPVSSESPSSFEPVSVSSESPSSFEPVSTSGMQDEISLPAWPRQDDDHKSAEAASFDPVPVQEHRESAEFRVQVGEGGSTEVVPVSQQDSQAETMRSIERHVERLVSLLEDMT